MALYLVLFTAVDGTPRGACVVEADDRATDIDIAHKVITLDLWPAGAATEIRRMRADQDVPMHLRNRLLSPTETAEFIGET